MIIIIIIESSIIIKLIKMIIIIIIESIVIKSIANLIIIIIPISKWYSTILVMICWRTIIYSFMAFITKKYLNGKYIYFYLNQ